MGNPQIEDGYTRIANELMEQVPRFKLNGTQIRIILVIWRYTYGFGRKHHEFSLSFLADALQASRSQIERELTALIDKRIIKVIGTSKHRSRILAFNKHYNEWLDGRTKTANNSLKPRSKKRFIRKGKDAIERLAAAQDWIEAGGDPYDIDL